MKHRLITFGMLLVFFTAVAQKAPRWRPMGPFKTPAEFGDNPGGTGRTSMVKFHPTDPNMVYAVTTTGGLFISRDEGKTWRPSGSDSIHACQTASVCIDPVDPRIIYLGTGDHNIYHPDDYIALYKSTDGGSTFKPVGNDLDHVLMVEMLISPDDHEEIVAATNKGIFKSYDGGNSWTAKEEDKLGEYEITDMKAKPVLGSKVLYITATRDRGPGSITPAKYFYSEDMGDTWNEVVLPGTQSDGFPYINGGRIGVSQAAPDVVYLYFAGKEGFPQTYTPVLRSDDSGKSFVVVKQGGTPNLNAIGDSTGGGIGNFAHCIAVDPTNADRLITGGIFVHTSENGGRSWRRTTNEDRSPTHTDIHYLTYSPHTGKLFMTHDGGISVSYDNGIHWTDANNGLATTETCTAVWSPLNKMSFLIGSQHNGGDITIANNDNPYLHIKGGDYGHYAQSDYYDANYFWDIKEGVYSIAKKEYICSVGLPFASGIDDDGRDGCLEFTPANKKIGFLGYRELYRVDNVGDYKTTSNYVPAWTMIGDFGSDIKAIGLHPANAKVAYVVTKDKKVRRTDNALSSDPTFAYLYDISESDVDEVHKASIAVLKRNPQIVFMAVDRHLYRSSNKGVSWTLIDTDLVTSNIINIIIDQYAAGESVYAFYPDRVLHWDGTEWSDFSSGLPTISRIMKGLIYSDSTNRQNSELRVITLGRGVYQAALAEYATYRMPENPSLTGPGIDFEYFEGEWEEIPNFNTEKKLLSGFSSNINIGGVRVTREDHFGIRYKGYIKIAQDGVYTFYLESDDGSRFYIGDELIADNDGIASGEERQGTIALKAGLHAITLEYFENSGDQHLTLRYGAPALGIAKQTVPGSMLSRLQAPYQCNGTGGLTREFWANVTGSSVSDIPVATPPTETMPVDHLQDKIFQGDNFGTRFRGYICAPYTGTYTFWIASGGNAVLYLSSDESPDNKQLLCSTNKPTGCFNFYSYAGQKGIVSLVQGHKYYVEVLHKDVLQGYPELGHDWKADYMAVQWQLPTGQIESPIPGNHLLPFGSLTYMVSPKDKAVYTLPAGIPLEAKSLNQISLVEFYANGHYAGYSSGPSMVYDWTPSSAGTYSVKAITYDDMGRSTESAPITVEVKAAPVQTGDIFGPDCALPNQTLSLEVNPAYTANAYNYHWWSDATPENSDGQSVWNVTLGSFFQGGRFCVDIYYSGGGYAQKCKQITNCAAREGEIASEELTSGISVAPNPASDVFTITVSKPVVSLTVSDDMGRTVYTTSDISAGSSAQFGSGFANGLYNVVVIYADKSKETVRILKNR